MRSGPPPAAARRGLFFLAAAAAALVGGAGAPGAAAAQSSRAGLTGLCERPSECVDAALTVEALQAGTALLLSGGSELPGSNSTLGRRFGTTPRVALSGRLVVANGSWPALGRGDPAPETGSWATSLQGALAVGLFDGFRPAPTVGGVLAVDLMATAGLAFLPEGDGFQADVTAFGYGVRLGVIRESFTLPGVTISAVRRHLGDVEWRSAGPAGTAAVVLESPVATSVRATVGKDLMALGIGVGVGWERVEADGRFSVPGGPGSDFPRSFSGFRTDRTLFFGGLTATFLVLQVHGEAGYAAGFDPVTGRAGDAFDPSAGSVFASLSARLLL